MISRTNRIRLRTAKRVMSTTYGNELAAALNGGAQPFVTGEGAPDRASPYFIGRVATSGPNDEDDYTDERYWVQAEYILGDEDAAAQLDLRDDNTDHTSDGSTAGPTNPNTFTVTNLGEWDGGTPGSGSHNLTEGTAVLVFAEEDVGIPGDDANPDGTPAQTRYVMCVGGVLPKAQYEGMGVYLQADGVYGASFLHGQMQNPTA